MGNSIFRRIVGTRFYPTDEELVAYYLKKKLLGEKLDELIAEINICDFEPSELSAKSILSGEQKLYFFCPTLKKYKSGTRTNRKTKTGFWKGTGKDIEVIHNGRIVGMRKTLIFHEGHPPNGTRTDWVMREYRMTDDDLAQQGVDQEAYAVCKVYKKSGSGPKNGEQYGAAVEFNEWDDDNNNYGSTGTSPMMISFLVNRSNLSSSSGVSFTSSTSSGSAPSTVTSSLTVYGLSEILQGLDLDASSSGRSTIISCRHGSFAVVPANNTTQEVEDRKRKKVMTDPVNENYVPVYNDAMLTHGDRDLLLCGYDTQVCNPDNVNMTSTEAGPSTLIYQKNERLSDVPLNNTTQEVEYRKGKKVMTDSVNENDVLDNDYVIVPRGDDDLMPCNNDTREVEDPKEKEVMTDSVNENYATFDEMFNFDEFAHDSGMAEDKVQEHIEMLKNIMFTGDEFTDDRMADDELQKQMEMSRGGNLNSIYPHMWFRIGHI